MSVKKKILIGIGVIFIAIQFFRPAKNTSEEIPSTDITKLYPVPENVSAILKKSCYDCHSNNTEYPWYAHVQPAAWYLASHIHEGKEELNFSEFGNYSLKRRQGKLKGVVNLVKKDEMPLSSYTLIHRDAILSDEEKNILITWASNLRDGMNPSHE